MIAKSAELSFVSLPSGCRPKLLPGAGAIGGAAATVPSTNAFVAVPQATESRSAPVASRNPIPPPVEASEVPNERSAGCAPAYPDPPKQIIGGVENSLSRWNAEFAGGHGQVLRLREGPVT